jgi:hypothetical protein
LKNSDKPAYPIVHGPYIPSDKGLTKREMLAMAAMQGLCSKPNDDKYHVNDGWLHPGTVAKCAIEIADELLKQLDNENQNPTIPSI